MPCVVKLTAAVEKYHPEGVKPLIAMGATHGKKT
tara:strand:- start:1094 stop:1195 length:102 start_codon:yes stop_codon:yes gene_type:complete